MKPRTATLIKGLLQEAESATFVTKDVPISFYGGKYADFQDSKAEVHWNLDLDQRAYGVKDITIGITLIHGFSEGSNDVESREFRIDPDADRFDLNIKKTDGLFIYPVSISVDGKRNKIDVEI